MRSIDAVLTRFLGMIAMRATGIALCMKIRRIVSAFCAAAMLAILGTVPAGAAPSEPVLTARAPHTLLTWYGQSAFRIATPEGHVLYVDPWLENPRNPAGKAEVAAIDKADLVLISHGHFDHVGNAVEIVCHTKARVVTSLELGSALVKYAEMPSDRMGFDTLGNVGGTLSFFNGEVHITFTQAIHSSSINSKTLGVSEDGVDHPAGVPTGFIITIRNGPTFYHTGDTAYFSDMAQLARNHVDVMLVCIGDHFTMGPADAARATAAVHPRTVIPMHYGTFPVLTGTPAAFAAALTSEHVSSRLRVMRIGETLAY